MSDRKHISEDDLEAYHMGIETEMALSEVKEHLLSCQDCLNRLKAAGCYVEDIQRAATLGEFDLETDTEEQQPERERAPKREETA